MQKSILRLDLLFLALLRKFTQAKEHKAGLSKTWAFLGPIMSASHTYPCPVGPSIPSLSLSTTTGFQSFRTQSSGSPVFKLQDSVCSVCLAFPYKQLFFYCEDQIKDHHVHIQQQHTTCVQSCVYQLKLFCVLCVCTESFVFVCEGLGPGYIKHTRIHG